LFDVYRNALLTKLIQNILYKNPAKAGFFLSIYFVLRIFKAILYQNSIIHRLIVSLTLLADIRR